MSCLGKRLALLVTVVALEWPAATCAASWSKLVNLSPSPAGTMLLLTDGTIMVAGTGSRWMRLTPDINGSYINGTWATLAPMSTPRLWYSSQVLPDGRVWLAGGEYSGVGLPSNWSGTGEIYDPVANSWSPIATAPTQTNCPYVNEFGGTLTKNSPVVSNILSTAAFETGWSVTGTSIPANTNILSIDSSTQIHLSQNATSNSVGEVLSFGASSTGNTTSGSAIITGIPSTAGFGVGWDVSGNGIPDGATISSVDSGSQIHISSKATATATGVALTFGIEIRPPSCLGDAPSMLLSTSQILVGYIQSAPTYFYNLVTNTWTLAANKVYGASSEQGWTRLSDGRILTYDIGKSNNTGKGYAEVYSPITNSWSSISPGDGTANGVLPQLSDESEFELGPALRLQDGRMFLIGGNGNTALYNPSTNTWAAGPVVNSTLNGQPYVFVADDAPGAILPNGHVIFAADAGEGVTSSGSIVNGSEVIKNIPSTAVFQVGWSVSGDGIPSDATITSVDSPTQIHISDAATETLSGDAITYGVTYSSPTQLFDFDPAANTIGAVVPAIPDSNLIGNSSFQSRMLMLPTGQLLFTDASTQLWIYTPDGSAAASLQPTISSVTYDGGGTYTLTGTQITGQSAGAAYGDDVQCDENYPIIRMVSSSGSVYYAKTTNWSTIGVATGSAPETVTFVPNPAMPAGTYSLIVSAAGISSAPATFSTGATINIQTSPTGLQFSVDGGALQSAPQTLNLTGGNHAIAVATTQPGASGTQYAFSQWSDSGAASHTINVTGPATYTATFTTQYLLTTAISPSGSGTVTAIPSGAYYNSGTIVQLTASAGAGNQFVNWSGDLSGSTDPQSITMNAPHSVTANFNTGTQTCSLGLSANSASLPATGTATPETCPNGSGQPSCGVQPETARSFTVTPSASCGSWTATSSNPGFLQIASGASGSGAGTVTYNLLANTHTTAQSCTITIASGSASTTYTVNEGGNADSSVYRQVYALYEQLLGRDPDAAGFAFWTGAGGAGLGQMADSFLTSPEAFNSDFAVMATYQAATGVPPTYAQYAAAVPKVRNNSLTVSQLFNSLVGGSYTATTLYHNLLNRTPSSAEINNANSAGLADWFQTLIGYPNSTTPVSSPNNEFQSTGTFHTVDHTNALYMQMVYYVTVSRDPDPAGLAFWIGIANNGGAGLLFQGSAGYPTRIQILGPGTPNQGFIGSPEFQGLFAN